MRVAALALAFGLASPALAFFIDGPGPACTGTGTACTVTDNGATFTASCGPQGTCGSDGATCTTDSQCYNYCGSNGICGGLGAACETTAASPDTTMNQATCYTPTYTCNLAAANGPVCQLAASPATRRRERRAPQACEKQGMTTCSVARSTGGVSSFSWECVDTLSSLEQCGGCDGATGGVDCTSLPGVGSVECVKGACVVESCESGFTLTDGKCF